MEKQCYKCKKRKSLSSFNKNRYRKDGLQSNCRSCSNARSRQYYQENTEKHKKVIQIRNKKIIQQNRAFVLEVLLGNPCPCGETDPAVLEFDHLRDKEYLIGTMMRNGCSVRRILSEMEKCQVLCANCHKRKTAEELGWYKFHWEKVTGV